MNISNKSIFVVLAILLISICLSGCNTVASELYVAPEPTMDPQIEEAAIAELHTLNPEAVPLYDEATKALESQNYQKAQQLYEKIVELEPNFATAYRRLGFIELLKNNIDKGIDLNRKAYELQPNAYNEVDLAYALLWRGTPRDIQEAFTLSSEAVKLLPNDEKALDTWLFSAGQIGDENAIRDADEKLLKIAPWNPQAHLYAGAILASDGKWIKADNEIKIAQQLGMSSEYMNMELVNEISRNASLMKLFIGGLIAMALWLLGLGILFLIGSGMSKSTIKEINRIGSTLNTQENPVKPGFRRTYKSVITILSLYYYLSVPFVILAVMLVVAGAFYIFFAIGSIPTYLAFILVAMALISIFTIIRSLFIRPARMSYENALKRNDAPELWNLVEEVARKLEVRPVDTIILTPGVEMGVYEEGSMLKKIRGAGKRNLILGIGCLSVLNQSQFSAILAHEYGHFSNRDTAGGNMAHQALSTINVVIQSLAKAKVAYVFNPAWWFVVGYQRIYLKVSQGASRLQEVLADRYAASTYGSDNFIDGLKNFIKQAFAFPLIANDEINTYRKTRQPIVNLYDLPLKDELSGELNRQYLEEMNRTTSEYDSHPAPKERLAWVERLHIPYSVMTDNRQPVLDLLPNAEVLQRKMTLEITDAIRPNITSNS